MKEYKNPVTLPPFTVKREVSTLSQNLGWQITSTHINDVWGITQGEGVKICIIDTGCPITKKDGVFHVHPDLVSCIDVENSKTFVEYEGIEDLNGHSTHCCGIIGMQNNYIGGVGVAPKVTITTYKALDANGGGNIENITNALKEALKHDFDIISMSLGCPVGDDIEHEIIKQLYNKNVWLVGASGNDGIGRSVNYPAAYPEFFAIGAFDKQGNLADFSCGGPELLITAPGVAIYSTYLNDTYAELSGTSMATPGFAGTLALLKSKHIKQQKETGLNDCVTTEQAKEHIKKYATDKGIIGKDLYWGYGIVDIPKLIEAQENGKPIIITPDEDPFSTVYNKKWYQKIKDWFWGAFVKPLPPPPPSYED